MIRGSFHVGESGLGVKLTTHLHLVPKLRMRGGLCPLLQYVYMVWCLIKQWMSLWRDT